MHTVLFIKQILLLQKLHFDPIVGLASGLNFGMILIWCCTLYLDPLGLPFGALGTHFPHLLGVHFSLDFWNRFLMILAPKWAPVSGAIYVF